MLIVSKSAEKYLVNLISKEKVGTYIKIYILNPGTFKAECGMSYCNDHDLTDADVKIYCHKFNIFTSKKNISYLKNSKIDLIRDKLNYQLTLKAPYVKLNNSRQRLITLSDKIENFLNTNVNPNLSMHGGSVSLKEVTKEGFVFLKFYGGCNGCSMSKITLKEEIEKKLLLEFSELRGVKDITNHFKGSHSYY